MRLLDRFRKGPSRGTAGADPPPRSVPGPALPIDGYDSLSEKKLIARLSELSRNELAVVETYERSQRARPAILERLHYGRQGGVDADTAKAVGDFERKLELRGARSHSERATDAQNKLEALRQEERYHRERLDLYRAKLYGGRAVSQTKLRELERAADGATARLRLASQQRA